MALEAPAQASASSSSTVDDPVDESLVQSKSQKNQKSTQTPATSPSTENDNVEKSLVKWTPQTNQRPAHTFAIPSFPINENILKNSVQLVPRTNQPSIQTTAGTFSIMDVNVVESPMNVTQTKIDFSKLCIFCADDQSKKPRNKRETPRVISDSEHKILSLVQLATLGTKEFSEMFHRLSKIKESGRVARSHRKCLGDFYSDIKKAMSDAIALLVINRVQKSDLNVYSLKELLEAYEDMGPNFSQILKILIKTFVDGFIMPFYKDALICNSKTVAHIVRYYFQKSKDVGITIKECADILYREIKNKKYDFSSYPSPHNFLANAKSYIPAPLYDLISQIIIKSKRKNQKDMWDRKILAICHSIIDATRPKSFLSSILLGLGILLYKKIGSRDVIRLLSALGFSATYNELVRFEASCLASGRDFSDHLKNVKGKFQEQEVGVTLITIRGLWMGWAPFM